MLPFACQLLPPLTKWVLSQSIYVAVPLPRRWRLWARLLKDFLTDTSNNWASISVVLLCCSSLATVVVRYVRLSPPSVVRLEQLASWHSRNIALHKGNEFNLFPFLALFFHKIVGFLWNFECVDFGKSLKYGICDYGIFTVVILRQAKLYKRF